MTEQNMNEQNNESVAQPPRRNHRQPREHTRIDYIRQWFNIIFMLGAVVGVIFLFSLRQQYGRHHLADCHRL